MPPWPRGQKRSSSPALARGAASPDFDITLRDKTLRVDITLRDKNLRDITLREKDTGKVPPAVEPITPTGSWADGAEGIKAATGTQSGSKAAAAAAAAIVSSGMAGSKAADASGLSPKAAGNQRTFPTRRAPSPSPSKAAGAEERSTESKLLDAISALAAKVDQQHEHAPICSTQRSNPLRL